MVTMKLSVSLMVLVTVAKGDDGVAREEMSRVLNRFMRDVSREMRIVKETMATMAAKVDVLETEVTSIKQICRVQNIFLFGLSCIFCIWQGGDSLVHSRSQAEKGTSQTHTQQISKLQEKQISNRDQNVES